MDNGDIEDGDIEGRDEEFRAPRGRKYQPVVDNDRAVLEMSSIDLGSSSASNLKYLRFSLPMCVYFHVFVFVYMKYLYWIWK